MTFESLIEHYGYAAIFIGTFLEGETILVVAGFLAHRGYLELGWVIAWAFFGTYAGDQLFFHIGRSRGMALLEKRPRWQLRSQRVFELLERHQILVILGFRFLYGLRTVTPFLIGMSGVRPWRFLVLNGLGALVWATVVGGLGFMLGQTLGIFLQHIKRYEIMILAILFVVAAVYWLYRWQRERGQLKSKSREQGSCQD